MDFDVHQTETLLNLQEEAASHVQEAPSPPDSESLNCLTGLPEGEEAQSPPTGG